jgi:hypothetical protein
VVVGRQGYEMWRMWFVVSGQMLFHVLTSAKCKEACCFAVVAARRYLIQCFERDWPFASRPTSTRDFCSMETDCLTSVSTDVIWFLETTGSTHSDSNSHWLPSVVHQKHADLMYAQGISDCGTILRTSYVWVHAVMVGNSKGRPYWSHSRYMNPCGRCGCGRVL